MSKFCPNCGAAVNEQSSFCEYCGSKLRPAQAPGPQNAQPQYDAPQYQPPQYAAPQYQPPQNQNPMGYVPVGGFCGNGQVRRGIPAPGFSDRENDPEILAYLAKGRKIGRIVGAVVGFLPLIGFAVYSSLTGEMELPEALLYGAIISAVFFAVQIFAALRENPKNNYNATVMAKKWRFRRGNSDRDGGETEYVITVKTDDGRTKKIVERGRIVAYDLLDVGDRFRYHANFAFPYELYDKRKNGEIYCVCCQTRNILENDRCERCNMPLLK